MAYLPVSEEPLAYILGPDSVLFDFRGSYTLIDNGATAVPVTKHVRHINCALNSAPTSNFCNNLIQQNQTRLVPIVGTVVGGELKKKLEEQGFDPVVIKQTPAFDPHILHKNHSDGRLEVVVLDGGLKPSLEIVQKAVEKGDIAAIEGLSHAHGMIFALVWYPAKKTDNVKRVLYTGSASPDRVITALEKSAPLAIFQVPSVTSGQAAAGIKLPPRVRPSTGTSRSSMGAAPAKPTRAAPAARPAAAPARPSLGTRVAPTKPATSTTAAASRPARPAPAPARTAAAAPPKKPPVSAARKSLPATTAAQKTTTVHKTTVTQKAAAPQKVAPIQKPGAKPSAPKAPEAPKKEPEVPKIEENKVEEKKEEHKPVEAVHEQHHTPADVPLITLADTSAAPASVPLVTFDDPIEEKAFVAPVEHQESKPEVSSPPPEAPSAPETSFELAPEVRVIPATPEPPHVNHSEDEQADVHPPAPIPEVPEKPEDATVPAPPPVHNDVPVPPHAEDLTPTAPPTEDKTSDEIVVEPAPGFDEPIVPQPTGENGLLDDLDEPMQIRRISMDTERTDELAQQIAEMSINRSEQEVKHEEKEPVPEPVGLPAHHDAMMAAFSSILTQGHQLEQQIHQDFTGVTDAISNMVNTVVNGGSDHNENTTSGADKSKLMETRSSVVEAGEENKRYEEPDPALDNVLASVTAQSEQEDRKRSDDGEGWNSVNSGAHAGVLSMTLVRRSAAPSHPRLSRERYFELVTVPHTGNKCSFTSADQARDFFSSVRSRIYILASEDLPPFVLDGWLEGKKSWLRPETTSTIVPSTTAPAIQDFTTRQRSVLEEQNMKISPSIDHTKMVIQVEENPEELYAVKLLI